MLLVAMSADTLYSNRAARFLAVSCSEVNIPAFAGDRRRPR